MFFSFKSNVTRQASISKLQKLLGVVIICFLLFIWKLIIDSQEVARAVQKGAVPCPLRSGVTL